MEAAISHVQVQGQHLYAAILLDVTERRRAEAELKRMRAELSASHAALCPWLPCSEG
jgi:signal transduction histidine kinase